MSEAPNPVAAPHSVSRVSIWWKILLVTSLALNLLFIGGGVARFFTHESPGRMAGISEMQLIPRKFFGDMDAERRRELSSFFRKFRGDFREGRADRKRLAAELAGALQATPYDAAKVRAVVDSINATSSGLIGRGGEAAVEFIAKLTPDERTKLALRILERVNKAPGPPGDKD